MPTRLFKYLPLLVALIGFALTGIVWRELSINEQKTAAKVIQYDAASLKSSIETQTMNHVRALERMTQRWAVSGGTSREEWTDDATRYVTDFNGYQAVEWGGHIDCMAQSTPGEVFDFKVYLSSGHWVSFKGEVTYSDFPMGFGFLFLDLSNNDRNIIADIIKATGGIVTEQFQAQEEVSEKPQIPAQNCRLLVADDDVMTLKMLSAIIESQNCEAITAQDGREAFRILQNNDNFSAAIFDMMMPHLDGLDLIHYMKTDNRLSRIPIGMITAEQDPKIWNDSIAAGANVFLPKPFNPPQVQMMLGMLSNKNN